MPGRGGGDIFEDAQLDVFEKASFNTRQDVFPHVYVDAGVQSREYVSLEPGLECVYDALLHLLLRRREPGLDCLHDVPFELRTFKLLQGRASLQRAFHSFMTELNVSSHNTREGEHTPPASGLPFPALSPSTSIASSGSPAYPITSFALASWPGRFVSTLSSSSDAFSATVGVVRASGPSATLRFLRWLSSRSFLFALRLPVHPCF